MRDDRAPSVPVGRDQLRAAVGSQPPLRVAISSVGSIPIHGGVRAVYRRELDALGEEEREARLAELEASYKALSLPFRTVEASGMPEIVDPRETRPILCEWIEDAYQALPEQLEPKGRTMRR